MGKRKRNMQLPAVAALVSLMVPSVALSALLDVGPVVPQAVNSSPPKHGFPLWYRDTNRVPLELCLSKTTSVNGPMCLTQEPVPALPFSFPDNFGPEAFWWSADAIMNMPGGGDARLIMAVEAAFAVEDPIPGDQVSFARIRIRIDTPVAGTYLVTYPYGQMTFNVTDPDAGINITKDIGIAVNNFNGALQGEIGPFLYWDTGPVSVGGEWYIGDPNVAHRVLGSPFPDPSNPGQFSNFFRIQGPAAVGTLQTDLFNVMGKIYTDPIPTPLTVDRATYSRSAGGTLVSSFVTSEAVSNQTNPSAPFPENFTLIGTPSTLEVTGAGIPARSMVTNNPGDGMFFSTTGLFANSALLPTSIVVTNTADIPPTAVTVPLVDDVTISQANYRPLNKTLRITADSADDVANPVLQVFMPGMAAPLGTLTNGQLSVTFPVTDSSVTPAKTFEIPPASITVKSAAGGEATVPVTVAEVVDLPPTGSIVINGGAATTGSTTVTLTLAATDDSGLVTHMSFSKDNVNYFPFEPFATARQATIVDGPGVNTIYVKFRDAAGNISAAYSDTIILDNVPPTGSITINGGATYATNAIGTLTLSATDNNGSVTSMMFSKNGVNFFPLEAYATSRQVTLDAGQGVNTVYVRYRDAAGNLSPIYSDTIILDTIAPTGTIVINGGATTTNTEAATLTLSATDSNGVTLMQFSKDNVTWTPFEPYATTRNVTLLPGDGFKTMYVRYRDTAGNVSVPYVAVIILDTTP